jgi:hypothetical protein
MASVGRSGEIFLSRAAAVCGFCILESADDAFVFVVRADPEPKIAAIVKSCQRAETRTGAHRPQIIFDFLEAEGFQRRIFLPELEILAGAIF